MLHRKSVRRCKNTILWAHYALLSMRFLSRDVESTESNLFGWEVRNEVENDQPA
jgi:hypothetical protein